MNRAQRRAQGKDIRAQIKTQVFNQEKDSLRRHLEKTEAEMRDSLEHVYNGMYFATMAIAMHRCRLSQNTIYKAMSMADDLYGQLFDGKLTADDLEKMVVEEAGIKIEYERTDTPPLFPQFKEMTGERHQIAVMRKGKRLWDAICHPGTYGWKEGLLEIMGSLVKLSDGDKVVGWLTAQDVIDRIEGR